MELAVQRRSRAATRRMLAAVLAAATSTLVISIASSAQASPSVAKAWGLNNDGQLGNGSTESSAVPVEVSGLQGVTAIAGGSHHSLALLADGTVMAWGENFYGQLGDGTKDRSALPTQVTGLSEVIAVAAGQYHSLALLKNGTVMAWGKGGSGQLGDGATANSDVPVAVSGLSEVIAISAGGSFSLALLRDRTVAAWGEDFYGQLGNSTKHDSDLPIVVSGLGGVTAISAGFRHSLALLSNGAVMAWGDNEYAQLGNGSESESDVPVAVGGLSGASAISAGKSQSLAVVAKGAVMAWGDNEEGQLGIGSHIGPEQCGASPFFACSRIPLAVNGLSDVKIISAGVHSLAMRADGTVMAWGENKFGQLGDGTSTGPELCSPFAIPCSATPVQVSEPRALTDISAGEAHSLALGPAPPAGPLPELGRCIRVGSGGAYAGTSPRCIVLSSTHSGHFEWLPGPGSSPSFKDEVRELAFETVGKRRISCRNGLVDGEYTGAKTAIVNQLTMRGCADTTATASCQSSPLKEGVIQSSAPLEGELGFVRSGERPRAGWELLPKPPATSLASFQCGSGTRAAAVALEGSVIGRAVPIDEMTSSFELRFAQRAGKQIPESFEGGVRDVLTLATTPLMGANTSEQAGLQSTGVRTGEEPLEIKAKA
jgi:alpha-tubulin suppressor-like RCC1 family protein